MKRGSIDWQDPAAKEEVHQAFCQVIQAPRRYVHRNMFRGLEAHWMAKYDPGSSFVLQKTFDKAEFRSMKPLPSLSRLYPTCCQRLCARLDAVDFKLTAVLAAGAPWASLEVLRAYRVKLENLTRMNYALQSVTSTFQSFFYEEKEEKNQLKQEWKEHHFALHVYRKLLGALAFS